MPPPSRFHLELGRHFLRKEYLRIKAEAQQKQSVQPRMDSLADSLADPKAVGSQDSGRGGGSGACPLGEVLFLPQSPADALLPWLESE